MDAKGAQALKDRIDQAQKHKHVCKIHTIRDGKPVCVYCGQEMDI